MLRNAKTLEGFSLQARDGHLGKVRDFYFDDDYWVVRYFVIDTGGWLSGRSVLISPAAVRSPDWAARTVPVELTVEQVRRSPGVESEQPVSRDEELALIQYYDWPNYWALSGAGYADGALGMAVPPPVVPDPSIEQMRRTRVEHSAVAEHHLRSVDQVTGCDLIATDHAIGHVQDFLIDDRHWDVRYLVVDTRNWLPGQKVLIAPRWVNRIGWDEGKVYVDLPSDAVKSSPAYDPRHPPTEDYSDQLHDHYGRPRYDRR